jgi:hypothetical protein
MFKNTEEESELRVGNSLMKPVDPGNRRKVKAGRKGSRKAPPPAEKSEGWEKR